MSNASPGDRRPLIDAHRWKHLARWHGDGYYALATQDLDDVPVRLFLTPKLLESAEDTLYRSFAAVLDARLAEVQYKLWPLASLKGVEEGPRWRKRKPNERGVRRMSTSNHLDAFAAPIFSANLSAWRSFAFTVAMP